MQRQLANDVGAIVASMEAGGLLVTESAVIEQLKVKNREYARKPAVGWQPRFPPPHLRPCLPPLFPLQKLLRKAVQALLDTKPGEGGPPAPETPDTVSSLKRLRLVGGGAVSPTPGTPREAGYHSESRGGEGEPGKRRRKLAKAAKALGKAEGASDDEDALFGVGERAHTLATPPKERYSDIGGVEACLRDVMEQVECPITHPELYTHVGVQCPRGVLLHGPSGCGKTLLAHAIGGELGVYFRSVSGPEIVSGMSGESERKLREVFEDVVAHAPSILFIDEIDSIAGKRSGAQRGMDKRIVSQLLSCIDALSLDASEGQAVIVIGACNHPDDLDAALRRPGRFDREICLGVPDDKVGKTGGCVCVCLCGRCMCMYV